MNDTELLHHSDFRLFLGRVLQAILPVAAVCALLYVIVDYSGLTLLGSVQRVVTAVAGLLFMALYITHRLWPNAYLRVAIAASAGSFVLFASALVFTVHDELRAIWFLLGIGFTYLLIGRQAGLIYTLCSVSLIVGTNLWLDRPFSAHGLITLMLAMGWSSALYSLFNQHSETLYRQILNNERRYRSVVDHAVEGICVAQEGVLRFVNPQIAIYLGYEEHELLGKSFLDFVHPDDRAMVLSRHHARLKGEVAPTRYELRVLSKRQAVRWYTISSTVIDWEGSPATLNTLAEITDRKRAEAFENVRSNTLEMIASGLPLRQTLSAIVKGVESLDSDMACAVMLLDATGKRFLAPIAESLPETYNAALTGVEVGYGIGSCGTAAYLGKRVEVDNIQTHPYWVPYQDLADLAQVKACWSQPIRAANQKILGTFVIYLRSARSPTASEISLLERTADLVSIALEKDRAEEQIRNLAYYDSLTGLPNRRLFDDRLGLAIAACKRMTTYGAILLIDLDNFKPLNDTHGHALGDQLLCEVAQRLQGSVREVDTVARLGGDEFVVLLHGLAQDAEVSANHARTVAEKIRQALAFPYLLESIEPEDGSMVEHHCTASIGIVLFDGQEASQTSLLKRVDKAMYRAKELGRNQVWIAGSG